MPAERVCLGAFAGAHGVRGLVKVKAFTEVDSDLLAYGPLEDEAAARRFELSLAGRAKGFLLVKVAGVAGREAAAALKGTRLYVARDRLPPTEDPEVFYHADLIGLEARDAAGEALGRVTGVLTLGGGEVLEIEGPATPSGGLLVPFTKAAVPAVELAAGWLTVIPPDSVEAEAPKAAEPPKGAGQGAAQER